MAGRAPQLTSAGGGVVERRGTRGSLKATDLPGTASEAAVSDAVSMNVEGKLSSAGGDMRGLIRKGNSTIGRFVATSK